MYLFEVESLYVIQASLELAAILLRSQNAGVALSPSFLLLDQDKSVNL